MDVQGLHDRGRAAVVCWGDKTWQREDISTKLGQVYQEMVA